MFHFSPIMMTKNIWKSRTDRILDWKKTQNFSRCALQLDAMFLTIITIQNIYSLLTLRKKF